MQRDDLPFHNPIGDQILKLVIVFVLLVAGLIIITVYAYRELPARPFAADDYQWLLNVHEVPIDVLLRRAFDVDTQAHFYRPLVWLLFWTQVQLFGLAPFGYHIVSLGLHLLNAMLLGGLVRRLGGGRPQSLLAMGLVALHPAPFEAVVWISAQSELVAATLLLVALHLWRGRAPQEPTTTTLPPSVIFTGVALGLALLAKESAVIGLPLLMLLQRGPGRRKNIKVTPYLALAAITLVYLLLQIMIERRNYLLQSGGYGIGPQLVLNPLRSLALLIAPLPGTEHADAAWLVGLGGLVAAGCIVLAMQGSWPIRRWLLAMLLVLLPTAPFTSPPDSRYLYLPVLLGALGAGLAMTRSGEVLRTNDLFRPVSRILLLALVLFGIGAGWWATGEIRAREARFAAASGPGGSLWQLVRDFCQNSRLDRVVLVEPPLAGPHAEAIVRLACGAETRTAIVGRDGVASAREGRTVVISFPQGTAQIERD